MNRDRGNSEKAKKLTKIVMMGGVKNEIKLEPRNFKSGF
jgi:hypothetical protein